jgi:hypothetical protein
VLEGRDRRSLVRTRNQLREDGCVCSPGA